MNYISRNLKEEGIVDYTFKYLHGMKMANSLKQIEQMTYKTFPKRTILGFNFHQVYREINGKFIIYRCVQSNNGTKLIKGTLKKKYQKKKPKKIHPDIINFTIVDFTPIEL